MSDTNLSAPRVLGISGRSGSGKTTLIEAMLPVFEEAGWSVNMVKHSHHDIELDPPGKDSARFRSAGAHEVIISSPYRFSLSRELRGAPAPSLSELISRLSPADLTIVEGYHRDRALARSWGCLGAGSVIGGAHLRGSQPRNGADDASVAQRC